MKAAYIELSFWLTTIAGLMGIITQTLTGYPGDILNQDVLIVAGIVQLCVSFVAAALLKRASA